VLGRHASRRHTAPRGAALHPALVVRVPDCRCVPGRRRIGSGSPPG
jgi:hypothetical protein